MKSHVLFFITYCTLLFFFYLLTCRRNILIYSIYSSLLFGFFGGQGVKLCSVLTFGPPLKFSTWLKLWLGTCIVRILFISLMVIFRLASSSLLLGSLKLMWMGVCCGLLGMEVLGLSFVTSGVLGLWACQVQLFVVRFSIRSCWPSCMGST